MAASDLKGISLADEISLLSPLFKKQQQLALNEEAKNYGVNAVAKADWYLCYDNGMGGAILNEQFLYEGWEVIRQFFMNKANLIYFFNKPSGVIAEKPIFFLAINTEDIKRYAFKKQIKLYDFTAQNIKRVPVPNQIEYFQNYTEIILKKQSIKLFTRVQTSEQIYTLSTHYLEVKTSKVLLQQMRKILRNEIINYSHELEKEIHDQTFGLTELQSRRCKELYFIVKKFYFFAANQQEETVLEGLSQPRQIKDVIKALVMIVAKIMHQ